MDIKNISLEGVNLKYAEFSPLTKDEKKELMPYLIEFKNRYEIRQLLRSKKCTHKRIKDWINSFWRD